MIKLCEMMKETQAYQTHQIKNILDKTRQNCLHSEPNYGVLWFYFKDSLLDNAYEIWDQAQYDIEKEHG